MISHEAFVRTWMVTAGIWETKAEDRVWSALPLFHVTALGTVTWVLGTGATFFSDYSFDATRTLDTLRDEQITQFYPAYQPVTEAVLAHPEFDTSDLSRINTWLNVAPPEVLAKFQKRLPNAVQLTTYGGTEGGCVSLTRRSDPLEVRLNTCGACQPGLELRVVDPFGEPLGPGERGIIQFRGYNTLSGYYKAPEKTAETMVGDGWVTMQDLGVLDEEGRVLFLGRVKETLKVGGENVAPQEIEAQLSHPPGGQARAGRRHPRRAPGRGRGGVRRAAARPRGHRGGADRALPRAHRVLQGAADDPLHRRGRVADVGHQAATFQAP